MTREMCEVILHPITIPETKIFFKLHVLVG